VTTTRDEEIRVLLETARKKLKEGAPMNRRTFLSTLSGPRSVRPVGVHVEARRLSGRPVALAVIVVAALMAHDRFLTYVTHASLHPSSATLPMDSRRGVVARIEPLAR
jgi:hypothetical protein